MEGNQRTRGEPTRDPPAGIQPATFSLWGHLCTTVSPQEQVVESLCSGREGVHIPRTCIPGPQVSWAPGLSWRTDQGTSWHLLHLWVFHLQKRTRYTLARCPGGVCLRPYSHQKATTGSVERSSLKAGKARPFAVLFIVDHGSNPMVSTTQFSTTLESASRLVNSLSCQCSALSRDKS